MKKHRFAAEINVVPYIDVMLVLLVIFMVTAPLLTQGVKVNLPKADSELIDVDIEPIVVSIDKSSQLFINLGAEKKQSRSIAEIAELVRKVLKSKPETPVLIWADESISYGHMIKLMGQLQAAGITQVGLVTEPI